MSGAVTTGRGETLTDLTLDSADATKPTVSATVVRDSLGGISVFFFGNGRLCLLNFLQDDDDDDDDDDDRDEKRGCRSPTWAPPWCNSPAPSLNHDASLHGEATLRTLLDFSVSVVELRCRLDFPGALDFSSAWFFGAL